MRGCIGLTPSQSGASTMVCKSHARQNSPHIGKAGYDAGHWIVAMNLIFEIDKPLVLDGDEGLEHLAHRHQAVSHGDLTLLALEIRQILHVNVKQPRSHFADRLNYVCAGARRVADIDAASYARVHLPERLQHRSEER